uniref:DUF834 domain-containing protein n=1 Tax=Oryza nivara TaxID=4536 RepID=A0A0E0H7C0_ORYNI
MGGGVRAHAEDGGAWGRVWAMDGGMRAHAEDGGAWGWAWAMGGDTAPGAVVAWEGGMATGVGGGAQGRVAPMRASRDVPAAGGAEEGVGRRRGRTQLGAAGWR